jgi:hypothetical protein
VHVYVDVATAAGLQVVVWGRCCRFVYFKNAVAELEVVPVPPEDAMARLGARDSAQLVVFACEAGLVRPGWTA